MVVLLHYGYGELPRNKAGRKWSQEFVWKSRTRKARGIQIHKPAQCTEKVLRVQVGRKVKKEEADEGIKPAQHLQRFCVQGNNGEVQENGNLKIPGFGGFYIL